jgi:hypothetical protein
MTTKEKIEVMQAFEDGKDIEHRSFKSAKWMSCLSPVWDWTNYKYRVKSEALEDRIKAQYSDYEVVMLVLDEGLFLSLKTDSVINNNCHIYAQSMKGFCQYVYIDPDGDFDTNTTPTVLWDKGVTLHPTAVLFTRGEG